MVFGLFKCEVNSRNLFFFLIAWLVPSPVDTPNTRRNPFSGHHRFHLRREYSWDKTVVNKLQSFRIVFIYRSTQIYFRSIKNMLCSLFIFTAAYIVLYISILYLMRTRDAGRSIIIVETSTRRPVRLHRSVLQ